MRARRPPATVLCFWDYDTQWGGDRSRSGGGPKAWGALEFELTERVLELHAEHEVPACFAVVGAAALPGSRPYHDPEQIRRIADAGHEVASHSFRHDWLPGLARRELLETLRCSKDALEQCTGRAVISFVPPYNQPFDYASACSFSLSERRATGADRTDVAKLCEALCETGYKTCRVAYRSVAVRVAEWMLGRRLDRPQAPVTIGGVTCLRLSSPGGFAAGTMAALERCVRTGGLLVAYGHPHSLRSEGAQHEKLCDLFLRRVAELRRAGRVQTQVPRELVLGGVTA